MYVKKGFPLKYVRKIQILEQNTAQNVIIKYSYIYNNI